MNLNQFKSIWSLTNYWSLTSTLIGEFLLLLVYRFKSIQIDSPLQINRMEPESLDVIDVESEQIDFIESESIEFWYSASQVQRLLDLNKAALQKAIAKLTSIYAIDLKILRRGGARATEYSQIALDAIKLLDSQKFTELRKLVEKMPVAAPTPASSAIVLQSIDRHAEVARQSSSVANQNLVKISGQIASLMGNYRQLGETLGEEAGAYFEEGFTSGVSRSIKKISEV